MKELNYQLLPCPFCGSEELELHEHLIPSSPCGNVIAFVECVKCGAKTKEYTKDGHGIEHLEDAVSAWNRRSNEKI